jgi:hypothetical protein
MSDEQSNDYVSRPDQDKSQVPVQSDNAPIDDPIGNTSQDSDEQLGLWHLHASVYWFMADSFPVRDDNEAIDESNIMEGGRTRGAAPQGGYTEPGDTEGLPEDDGTSAVTQ